jgi:hypothetical protein
MGLPLNPAIFIPGLWGAGGTGCTGIVRTGPAAATPGAAGTDCSTSKNLLSRYRLATLNPGTTTGQDHGGNQLLGGGGGSVIAADQGTANYNGLIASVNHRLSSTFSLLANWTWSKCLNIEDAQGDLAGTTVEDPNNIMLDYGPCGSDYRHIENATLVVRSHFALSNRLESLAVNGWEFAPLVQISSGSPFTVTSGVNNSLTNVTNDRPNLVSGAAPYAEVKFRKGSGSANREYLNPAAFEQVTANCPVDSNKKQIPGCKYLGTFGNISRDSFRGPKAFTFDAQISREFPIHERLTTTLRLEAFNVLNHPNFNNPTASLSSSTFGQVSGTSNSAREFQGSVKINF